MGDEYLAVTSLGGALDTEDVCRIAEAEAESLVAHTQIQSLRLFGHAPPLARRGAKRRTRTRVEVIFIRDQTASFIHGSWVSAPAAQERRWWRRATLITAIPMGNDRTEEKSGRAYSAAIVNDARSGEPARLPPSRSNPGTPHSPLVPSGTRWLRPHAHQ